MQNSERRCAKIALTIGNLSFSGEGDQDWLDQQISRLIDIATPVQVDNSVNDVSSGPKPKRSVTVLTESLPSYLRTKGADTVQNQRFLATAAWLQHRGEKVLTTQAVSKALRDNQQKRLGNASECLNQNVGKGFCEKTTAGEFFITPEGWKHLGEDPVSSESG